MPDIGAAELTLALRLALNRQRHGEPRQYRELDTVYLLSVLENCRAVHPNGELTEAELTKLTIALLGEQTQAGAELVFDSEDSARLVAETLGSHMESVSKIFHSCWQVRGRAHTRSHQR